MLIFFESGGRKGEKVEPAERAFGIGEAKVVALILVEEVRHLDGNKGG